MSADSVKKAGWDLLWTNPNPSADYASGTVPINLNDYSYVVIDFAFQLGSILVRVGGDAKPMGYSWGGDGNQYAFLSRYVRVTSTEVFFDVVNQVTLNTAPSITFSTRVDLCKPLRIWGIT